MKRTRGGNRRFSREFKLEAVERVERGEMPSKVARSLGVDASLLSKWSRQVRSGGETRLKEVGRPPGSKNRKPAAGVSANRVAQLERMIGRQQEVIDFLERALRRVEELRQSRSGNGGTASSR